MAREVLEAMRDHCDLVSEGNQVWCGTHRTNRRVLNELLSCVAVSVEWEDGKATYYRLNETGRSILRHPELENEVRAALRGHKGAFTIRDDRIVTLP